MMKALFGPTMILAAGLCLIDHGLAQPRDKETSKDTSFAKSPSRLGVEIADVKDLDQIDGFVRSVPKRKVRITLANTIPFSRWPKELSKEETKFKQEALAFVKSVLLGKEGKEMTFWGIDAGETLHGDLVSVDRGGPHRWNGDAPSGKLGWFITHINAMLIESGYSVYAEDPKHLTIALTDPRGLDRHKFLMAAESYAAEKRKGLWNLGKDREFATKLKSLLGQGK
jgi:endonuclease YncB( thermonuclease family)